MCTYSCTGHGQDDYVVGIRYKMPVISPVNNKKGYMTEEAGPFAGLFYKEVIKL